MKKDRQSNIELLRILAIIMITLHHFSLYLGLYNNSNLGMEKNIFGIVLFSLGKIGVNIFIIISGYFLIDSKFNIKKIIKLWLEVLFYSVSILIIGELLHINTLSFNDNVKALLPISYQRYWFASAYMYLLFLAPILNLTIAHLSKAEHKRIIIMCTIMFSLIYSILFESSGFGEGSDAMDVLLWFMLLYFIGAYVKKYDVKIKNIKIKTCIFFIIFEVFMCISKLYDSQISNILIYYYTRMNSIFVLLISIGIFIAFKNITIKTSKIINNIAKASFPVYLIQEHNLLKNLWQSVINPLEDMKSLVISSINVVIILFAIAIVMEIIRRLLFEKLNDKISNKIERFFLNNLKSIL